MFSFFKRKKEKKVDQISEVAVKATPAISKEQPAAAKSQPDGPSEPSNGLSVKVYSLSTCSHCKAAKKFLSDCTIKYDFVDVDQLQGEERKAILEDVKKFNPKCTFPTIIIGDKVIIGNKEWTSKNFMRN
jgi:glutaredoxin-like protein NrdH